MKAKKAMKILGFHSFFSFFLTFGCVLGF
jgi:hypothetical protein